MAEPCAQEKTIASIQALLHEVHGETTRSRAALERVAEAMKQVAEQSVEIRHLREDSGRHERELDSLYSRMRSAELAVVGIPRVAESISGLAARIKAIEEAPGRVAGKLFFAVVAAACSAGGGLITALILRAVP